MQWLNKGLCVCGLVLALSSCAQNKELPQGERISILDDFDSTLSVEASELSALPAPMVNSFWMQNGMNASHIIGNLKADTTLKEVWRENFGRGISKRDILLSAPVVLNNRIFVMDAKGEVSAFNLENGTLLWENNLTAKSQSVQDAKSKASGLAVDNNLVFATTGFGGIYAMDAITGKPKWRKVLESPIRIAPLVIPGAVLVQTVDNKLYALDKISGNELWRFGVAFEDTVIAGGATPCFDKEDNIVVAGFSNGEIVVLNASIGTPLWTYSLVSNERVNSTTELNTIGAYPIVENGTIYAISNSNTMVALDIRTGDVIWKNDIGSMQNMLLAGDYLFLISNRNILYAVDKEDGNIMWSLDMRDFIASEDEIDGEVYASQPIMINGNILLAFSNGKMFKINASKGKVIAKTDLEIDISNGVIIAKEKVIAVSDEADVIVFE